ncbi:MAG: hypothetical protein ABII02_03905 [Candidatus Magasanikbacteria bacterium]
MEQGRAETLKALVEETAFIFAKNLEYQSELLVWKKSTTKDAKEKLEELMDFFETIEKWEEVELKTMKWIQDNGYGNGDVLWPMRVALSGKKNSPSPFEIAQVLGKGVSLKRISAAIEVL